MEQGNKRRQNNLKRRKKQTKRKKARAEEKVHGYVAKASDTRGALR